MVALLPSAAARFAELHAAELPQKDELCGAFCALLALRAAGTVDDEIDQDAVAEVAGTRVTAGGQIEPLPPGEPGRRDYRLQLPTVADAARSGTTVAGIARAVEQLSGGASTTVGLRGPFPPGAVVGLLELTARARRPVTLIANVATAALWAARSGPVASLRYLGEGTHDGLAPDWDVGHFVCLLGTIRGPVGTLVIVADTYPSLGWQGIHLQPVERVAAALERRGVLAVVDPAIARDVSAFAAGAGLVEGLWDNGTAS